MAAQETSSKASTRAAAGPRIPTVVKAGVGSEVAEMAGSATRQGLTLVGAGVLVMLTGVLVLLTRVLVMLTGALGMARGRRVTADN